MSNAPAGAEGLTRRLVEAGLRMRADELPGDVRRVARDCLVDWLGCAMAAQYGLEC